MNRPYSASELFGWINQAESKHAPDYLWAAGHPELLNLSPRVSIVGSRNASPEGLKKAGIVARTIVGRGGVVVSGLARGIDAAAHVAAIEAGGRTIGVIGTPIDKTYPRENADLQREIAADHLLISQFAPDTVTRPQHFVMRNRTMALISQATLIIEAGEKSGTEHQGWEAIRLGRILILPQKLVESDFEWPRKMCGYGAVTFGSQAELENLLDECLPAVDGEVFSDLPF